MLFGAASCALGLPKIISKGIGALSLVYLYYYLCMALGAAYRHFSLTEVFQGQSSFIKGL